MCDETALQLGRDAMELGLIPFLMKLVGPANASRLLAGVCGCPCDACTEYCEQGALTVDEPAGCTCAVSATELCRYCDRVQTELSTKLAEAEVMAEAMNPEPWGTNPDDCCGQPDACCGCSCPPQEDDDLTRPVAADCGVHGNDGCIASGLTKDPDDDIPVLLSVGGVRCVECDDLFQSLADHVRTGHCVTCGSTDVVYQNYQEKWFCCSCAQCCDTTEEERDDRHGILAAVRRFGGRAADIWHSRANARW